MIRIMLLVVLQIVLLLVPNYTSYADDIVELVDITSYIKSKNSSSISTTELINELDRRHISLMHENDDGTTLCHLFATYNYLNLIEYTIDNINTNNVYDFINKQDKYGDTCIHKACFNGNIDIVKFLKFHQANVLINTKIGVNPLHSASYKGYNDIVELLVKDYKVPINIKTGSEAVPLHYAVGQNNHRTVSLLLELGADVNAVNKDNITAIHIALKNKRLQIAKALIQAGAKLDIKNNKGEIPLDYVNDDILSSILEKDL